MADLIIKGAARRRKVLSTALWIVMGCASFAVCAFILFQAYTTHWVPSPVRRGMSSASLGTEPGLFWAAVTVYTAVLVCAPVAVALWTVELLGQLRPNRQKTLYPATKRPSATTENSPQP